MGGSKLVRAASSGQIDEVSSLIDLEPDAISRPAPIDEDHQTTPILAAAIGGHKEIMITLLGKGALLDETDCLGMNVLHYAARFGHEDLVDWLCDEKQFDTTLVNKWGNNALQVAAAGGQNKVIDLLVTKYNMRVTIANKSHYTPLHLAVQYEHQDTIKHLVTVHKLSPNIVSKNLTLLQFSLLHAGSVETLQCLLSLGADPTLAYDDYQKIEESIPRVRAIQIKGDDHDYEKIQNLMNAIGNLSQMLRSKVNITNQLDRLRTCVNDLGLDPMLMDEWDMVKKINVDHSSLLVPRRKSLFGIDSVPPSCSPVSPDQKPSAKP